MSEAAATKKDRKPRRRQAPKKAADGAAAEKKPREPRAPSVPVPDSMVGSAQFGRVCDVLSHSSDRFGFIYVTPQDDFKPAAVEGKSGLALFSYLPRIYFNTSEWKEGEGTRPRKNDLVKFSIKKDDKDRPYAAEMSLTPAGRVAAAARDAALAEAQKNAPPKSPRAEGEGKPKRERNGRVRDERTVVLKVTCDGFPGSKEVTACLGETIGKLKHSGITAFEAPVTLNVFYKGEMLTKATLATLAAGETIHLGAPKA